MKTRRLWIGFSGLVLVILPGILAYRHWHARDNAAERQEMLSLLPADPSMVMFLDLQQFRNSAFLPQLLAWVPRASAEKDYADFVRTTGFQYERDLDRVALAFTGTGANAISYAIAEGRFNRKKLLDYAKRSGRSLEIKGLQVVSLNLKPSTRPSFLAFLRDDQIAWTNDTAYEKLFLQTKGFEGKRDWREHFERLAGSAVFAVVREDAAAVAGIQQQTPGGFRSPQLATLLTQLQWITIGGKPEEKNLRVVIEGESETESALNQLKEFLQGILIMAQAGLNGPQNRKQMDRQLREAYVQVLKSAEVEKVDRGAAKSVRVVFEVTPEFLEAVKTVSDTNTVIQH